MYTNSTNRLNYLVGDQTYTISHFDQSMYLLGYLPRDGRVYVADKDVGVISYALSLSVVEYQTLVLRGDMDAANDLLASIPDDQKNKIARFLEGQGYKELALEVATDPEHRFDLALALNNLSIALDLAKQADADHKWKTVGDAALSAWDVALAEECFTNAKDLGSLLLLYSSTANGPGLRDLASLANAAGANNIAFSALWQLADVDACIELLLRTGRAAEAVLFAQTYRPSRAKEVLGRWKKNLEAAGKGKVSRLIAVPETAEDEEFFPEWEDYLRLEKEAGLGKDLIDIGKGDQDRVDGNGEEDGQVADVETEDGVDEVAAEA